MATAIIVGTNSWATVAEADAYFAARIGAGPWFTLTADAGSGATTKDACLISAFYWIKDDPNYSASPSLTSSEIKRAQFEAALFLLNYGEDYANRQALGASGVTSFEASEWSETIGQIDKPKNVRDILQGLGLVVGRNILIDLEALA